MLKNYQKDKAGGQRTGATRGRPHERSGRYLFDSPIFDDSFLEKFVMKYF